MPDLPAV